MQPQPDPPRAGGFPIPPGVQAQMDAPPQPADMPEGAITSLDYWGALAEQEALVPWMGRTVRVRFRLPDGTDELAILAHANRYEHANERAVAEAHCRLARAVTAVDGQQVAFPDFAGKLAWVQRWPMSLVDAALEAYVVVVQEPVKLLGEAMEDPNSDAPPSTTGEPTRPAEEFGGAH